MLPFKPTFHCSILFYLVLIYFLSVTLSLAHLIGRCVPDFVYLFAKGEEIFCLFSSFIFYIHFSHSLLSRVRLFVQVIEHQKNTTGRLYSFAPDSRVLIYFSPLHFTSLICFYLLFGFWFVLFIICSPSFWIFCWIVVSRLGFEEKGRFNQIDFNIYLPFYFNCCPWLIRNDNIRKKWRRIDKNKNKNAQMIEKPEPMNKLLLTTKRHKRNEKNKCK